MSRAPPDPAGTATYQTLSFPSLPPEFQMPDIPPTRIAHGSVFWQSILPLDPEYHWP